MEARRARRRASYDSQKSELSNADRMREKKRQKTQYSLRQAGLAESDRASMNEGRRVQYADKRAGMSESDRASMNKGRRVQYADKRAGISESDRASMNKGRRVQYADKRAGMSESDRASVNKGRRVQYADKQAGMSESERASRNARRRDVTNAAKSQMSVDEMNALRSRQRVKDTSKRQQRGSKLALDDDSCSDEFGNFVLPHEKLKAILSHANWDRGFQADPRMATLLYHLNSGHYRFDQWKEYAQAFAEAAVDIEGMRDEILGERLTDAELRQLMDKFYSVHSLCEGDLFACGACGWRQMERKSNPNITYEEVPLDDDMLRPLMFNTEQRDGFDAMKARGGIAVPSASGVESTTVYPWKVLSVVSLPVDPGGTQGNRYMHLHPETVEHHGDGSRHTRICPMCVEHLRRKNKQGGSTAGKIPPLSIAAGVDFGCYRRAGLPELTLHEEIILSRVRMYFASVKITSNTSGKVNLNTRSAVKGNAILFKDDSAKIVSEILDKEILKEQFHIHMVDASRNSDEMMKKMLKTTALLARPWVLFRWLVVLKAVNPFYQDLLQLNWETVQEEIESLNGEIVRKSSLITNRNAVNWEQSLGSDVAKSHYVEKPAGGGRHQVVAQLGSTTDGHGLRHAVVPPGDSLDSVDDEPLPLRCSVLVDMPGTRGHNNTSFADRCTHAVSEFVLKHSSPESTSDQRETDRDGVSGGRNSQSQQGGSGVDEARCINCGDHVVLDHSKNGGICCRGAEDDGSAPSGGGSCDCGNETVDGCDIPVLGDETEDGGDIRVLSDVELQGFFVQQRMVESQREPEPLNEIDNGGELMVMAFPSVFLLGKSYATTDGLGLKGAAKLTKTERNHMFCQHTLVPTKNRMLLAYLHNTRQRFEVNCGVKAHVAENPRSVEVIAEMLADGNVRDAFQYVKENPHCPKAKATAKRLARKYSPLLRFSGQNVSYGAVECYGLKSSTFEMCKRYALPFSFLTISYADGDNPRSYQGHEMGMKCVTACNTFLRVTRRTMRGM